jgi:hypothetical protein
MRAQRFLDAGASRDERLYYVQLSHHRRRKNRRPGPIRQQEVRNRLVADM